MIAICHFIVHILGIDYGLPYGKWGWYNFWSGVGGSFLISVILFGPTLWWHHTCHVSTCLRLGRHPVGGTPHKACRRHHPDDIPARITAEYLASATGRSQS